ncbi:MAG: SusF/SusE family outer membrane protein [Prevotellaceae bacterium]|jgi:hypothetical protein|nr:SusF/SusE family outer membrane protein [Prevotellaceae bacterium]
MLKNNLKFIASLFIVHFSLFIGLTSCSENLMELNKGKTPLAIAASRDSIALDILNPTANALTYNWTTGTNYGTGAAISYQFQIAASNFENAKTCNLGKNVTSIAFTNEELNSILLNELGVEKGAEVNLQARVIATVLAENIEPQITEPLLVNIKTYKPIAKNLYLLGSASPNGWNADNALKMNAINGTAGGFTWQGRLLAGELKFITALGEFLPSYNRGANENNLFLRENDSQPDDKFNIAASGMYRISLNIIALTISIEVLDAPEFSNLWFVGGFTDWNFVEMRPDLLDPYIFYYNAELSSSNATDVFKIATAQDFDDAVIFFRPAVNGQGAGTNLSVVKWSIAENPQDNQWSLVAGTYKIKLNIGTMKIDIVPFAPFPMIYLVGEATPNGWNIEQATEMQATADPNKFTWTGHLTTGEMKFTCDRQADWNGAFFLASAGGISPSGSDEPMIFSPNGSNPDNKWVIYDAGTYTIELDQLQNIVKITKN